MLVDLPAGWATDPAHPRAKLYAEFGHPAPIRLSRGHYEDLVTWDIEHLLAHEFPFDAEFASGTVEERIAAIRDQALNDTPRDFGVCDHPDQVLARWPELATDPRPFVIAFRQIRRADQSAHGGWRWRKWGIYLGEQDPGHEYLYDDAHIDVVYVFSIIQLTPAAAAAAQPAKEVAGCEDVPR